MRLSRVKLVQLSHAVTKVLVEKRQHRIYRGSRYHPPEDRGYPAKPIEGRREIDLEVRKKIASQKKEILEGSEEWDLLYRRHYSEELKKKGVGMVSER